MTHIQNIIVSVLVLVFIAALTAPSVPAQKIDREYGDQNQIIHLKTALNHVTVIELREPVVQVASGSQSFKVEWRENKVFVQPTASDATTNLFIWTSSERLNYELEPAGDVSAMDFAVDQIPAQVIQPSPAAVVTPQPTPTEILLAERPVRFQSGKPSRKTIEVSIRDWYEKDDRLLVRYVVVNRGTHVYNSTTPQVYALDGVRYSQSLYSLAGSQLSDGEAARLKVKKQNPLPVLEAHVQTEHLPPGEESVGIVAFHSPSSTGPTVLRFQFPNDQREQVAAFLVQ
jgi:hypothetical protein